MSSHSDYSESPDLRTRLLRTLGRSAGVLLSLGIASWIVGSGAVEWSFPYCSNQSDGPATPVFGFPLPYMRLSLATSITTEFMPRVYLLNVALLGGVFVATLGRLVCRKLPSARLPQRVQLGKLGALLLITQVLLQGLLVASDSAWPVDSIADGRYMIYAEYRPVRPAFYPLPILAGRDCTPSRWWFPDGWHPR